MVYDYKKRRESRGGGKRNKFGQVVTLGTNNERNKPEDIKSTSSKKNGIPLKGGKKVAKRKHTDIPGIPKQMGYPIARGPGDDTGDSLLIKCVQYVPSKISLDSERQVFVADEDGTFAGNKFKEGEKVYRMVDGKKQYLSQVKEGTVRLNNEGATSRLKNATAVYYIRLPIPQDVNDSNVVTWGDDSMNIFQLAGVAAAASFMKDPSGSFNAVKEAFNSDIISRNFGGMDELHKMPSQML